MNNLTSPPITQNTEIDIIIAIIIGISLSASCGFRIFIPLLGLSIAAYFNIINLNSGTLDFGN